MLQYRGSRLYFLLYLMGLPIWRDLKLHPKAAPVEIPAALDGHPDARFPADDDAGKRLQAQLTAREKVRAWADYTSVSKLRKPQWWQSEYGRPFSGWSGRMAKSANAAYDIALDALQGARDADAAQSAI